MFKEYKTFEILDFINSIVRAGKVREYAHLYAEALDEVEKRDSNIALLYQLKTKLDKVDNHD